MPGQIINRGDKVWLVRVFAGRDAQGKRTYVNRTIHGNKKDAEKVLAELLQNRDLGPLLAGKLTASSLLDDLVADYRINDKSLDWSEMVVRVHLRPHFGPMTAAKVTTTTARYYIMSVKPKARPTQPSTGRCLYSGARSRSAFIPRPRRWRACRNCHGLKRTTCAKDSSRTSSTARS